MSRIAVTGVSSQVGRRVVDLLERDPEVERVVELDSADVLDDDLKPLLEGVRAVVLVSPDDGPAVAGAEATADGTRRVLDAAGGVGVDQVVLLSTAMVYGAWPDNPVPLTEDAPLRPNPGFVPAAERAEAERLVAEWVDAHPGAVATVLRPTVVLAEQSSSWLARALRAAAGMRAGDEPPAQFVHADDVAAAVDLVLRRRLPGVFNVAPEGWVAGDQVRALAGPRPRVRLPERIAARLAPPGLLPYTVNPWVVASDRLRAEGWQPTHSNEEAFVVGQKPGPLANLSPKRRQELALGAMVAAVAGLVALTIRFWRR